VRVIIQGESLARGHKHLSMYTVEQLGFLVRKYWQTGSFKAWQTAFRTEFHVRRTPSKNFIQKSVKKLETSGNRFNAYQHFSLGPIEEQSVENYTPHKLYKTTHHTKCTKLHPTQIVQNYTQHKVYKTTPHTKCTKLHPTKCVQSYTPHNRTTQRRYTPGDSSRQLSHFRKSIPEFGEKH